jgi:NAD(P)-dependent dehydrogenase (short-subunit alcohol dehydrogenase family)
MAKKERESGMNRRDLLKILLSGSAALTVYSSGSGIKLNEARANDAPSLKYGNPTFPLSDADFSALEKVDVSGKVAVITGASTGIGRAAAEDLASRGFTVIGTSRSPENYPPPPNFQLWKLDLTIPGSIHSFAEKIRAAYPRINLLVLNAARFFFGRFIDSDMRKVQEVYDTNMNGHQILYRLLEPALPTGEDDYARVFFTSSIEDRVYLFESPQLPGISLPRFSGELNHPYSVSKTAIARAGHLLYGRLRNNNSNIQITVFYPGFFIKTNILNNTIYGNDPNDPEIAFAREIFGAFFAQGADPAISGRAYGQMAELKNTFLTSYIINQDTVPGSLEDFFQNNYWISTVMQEEDRTVRSIR